VQWRIVLGWTPVTLFVALVAAGTWLCAVHLGDSGVFLFGALDAAQLGVLLLLAATACVVVAVIQAAVFAGRLGRLVLRVLVRAVSVLLLLAAIPAGYLLMLVAAFSSVHADRLLAVPGHTVVARSFTWHHHSLDLLEQDGAAVSRGRDLRRGASGRWLRCLHCRAVRSGVPRWPRRDPVLRVSRWPVHRSGCSRVAARRGRLNVLQCG